MDGGCIFGKVGDYREDGRRKTFRINLEIYVVGYYICVAFVDGAIRKLDMLYHGI